MGVKVIMKIHQVLFLLSPIALVEGCANPYDIKACEGGRYQPPYYGTYPDSSYYDNDYYKNFERNHFGVTDPQGEIPITRARKGKDGSPHFQYEQ